MMEVANPFSSGEGCQTMNIKRKKLKEGIYFYATNARQETSSDVNYYLDCLYNPLSDSNHCRNWMTYAVRATRFFQDTEYFLQLPVVSG